MLKINYPPKGCGVVNKICLYMLIVKEDLVKYIRLLSEDINTTQIEVYGFKVYNVVEDITGY